MNAAIQEVNRTHYHPPYPSLLHTHSNNPQSYWDWSLDATPEAPTSTTVFSSEIFSPHTGFGGNGAYIAPTPAQNPLNISGGTGGGCVLDGPFVESAFTLHFPSKDCLRRDFIPWIMNIFADARLVEEVMSQPDYTSFARTLEKKPSFTDPNIHAGGHFGVGGVLGNAGNAANSPGGMYKYTFLSPFPLFYCTFDFSSLCGNEKINVLICIRQNRCSIYITAIWIVFFGSGSRWI